MNSISQAGHARSNPLADAVLSMVFWSYDPVTSKRWTCMPDAVDAATCQAAWAEGNVESFCQLYGRTLGATEGHAFEWTAPKESIAATFGLVCGREWAVAVINALFFVGFWLGSILGAFLT